MSNFDEKISCLFDDETNPAEREQLIKLLKQRGEYQDKWGRYGLIQEALKRNLPDNPKHDLFSRVSAALESEPVLLIPGNDKVTDKTPKTDYDDVATPAVAVNSRRFAMPNFGWAAAAAVAMFVVVGTVTMNSQTQEPGAELMVQHQVNKQAIPASQTLNIPAEPVFITATQGNTFSIPQIMPSPEQWERIDQIGGVKWDTYIQEHSETATQNGVQPGVVPFARTVNFGENGQRQ
ncbi:MAG: sigma-E factor negative regulatory protein [Gammaproteobacteria bacterium]|nr:sigma-E factor negative regulatory protein [Gammaproteobacteria bacterium]